MKKTLFISTMALLLSCSNSETKYTKCVETSFNFNKQSANKIVGTEKKEGSFKIELGNDLIKIIDEKGESREFNTNNGYSLTHKKSGDTLIIQNLPTESTPSEILKFGFEYKFYN